MNYKIIISPIASKNIEDAVEYYIKEATKKVASGFSDFKETYKALQKSPFYQFHDKNYRFIPLTKFPYDVFFIVDESSKTVFLNAVFHTSQNRAKYPAR